ncbi:MAG: toll/interleukin-1 receptor domain-containing protein [Candidatus Electrothrix sp. Rat3]|nr:toll/interleukin-1 receptor domain-containing protein [Candidatus Electrothrix rattekaaiensis]
MSFSELNSSVEDLRNELSVHISEAALEKFSCRLPGRAHDEAAFLRLTIYCYILFFEVGRVSIPYLLKINPPIGDPLKKQLCIDTRRLVNELRTSIVHNLDYQDRKRKSISQWFLKTCQVTLPKQREHWGWCFKKLCDDVKSVTDYCSAVLSTIASSDDDNDIIFFDLQQRIDRNWPTVEFDKIITDAAVQLGEKINVVKFRNKNISKWRDFLDKLPGDVSLKREVSRIIERDIFDHFRSILPVTTNEIMEALDLSPGPKVKRAIAMARELSDTGIREPEVLLRELPSLFYPSSVLPKARIERATANHFSADRTTFQESQAMNPEAILNEKRRQGDYDVFLCHNSTDKPAVRRIGEILLQFGILPWLDEWDLQPGKRWQRVLQDQIAKVKTAAVFVGPSGMGPWQNMEIEGFLDQFVQRDSPVIPVVLPECEKTPTLLPFLKGFNWIDFRKETPNPLNQLIWGITGERPALNPNLAQRIQAEQSGIVDEIRDVVRQETERIREQLSEKLKQTSRDTLQQLSYAQIAIINALTIAANESRIQENDVAELLQAVSTLRNNLPAEHVAANILQSLPSIVDDPKVNVSNKLKVTLPIIPFLLSYEGECQLTSGCNLRLILQRVAEKIRL